MAICHLHSSYGSRKDTDSAVDELRYVLRRGKYARARDRCVESDWGNLPPWCEGDPLPLFEAADLYERMNTKLYQELEGAIQVELNLKQSLELVRAMANSWPATACRTRGGSRKGGLPSRGNHGTGTGTCW